MLYLGRIKVATRFMSEQTFINRIFHWLKSTEMFAQPSKQLPGKWQLFEYYTETCGELLHIQEEQLKSSEVFWEIEFYEDGVFNQQSNSLEEFMKPSGVNRWSLSKNFVTLLSNDFRNSIEYQFAIDKGTLKLLKKDFSGKIEFFGFFRKPNKK